MIVELDIFSGRPNPRWQLGPSASDQLRGLLAALDSGSDLASPAPPALGYRGFRIDDPATGSIRAFRGVISGKLSPKRDPERRVERFLLGQVPPDLDDLRAAVAIEIGSSDEPD